MDKVKKYFWNLLISVDQLVNTIFGGDPDETMSSRLGKRVYWHGNTGISYYLCRCLHWFDKDHCLKNIEEDEGERRN